MVFFSVPSPALAQYPPEIASVPATSNGPVAMGTRVICLVNPNSGASAPNCPILKLNGYNYWAFSYLDNRVGMAIVAYDANNRPVRQWERAGARYVWEIRIDSDKQTVAFVGQSQAAIVMGWHELEVGPGSLSVQSVNAQAINCLFGANCAAVTPTDSIANIVGVPNATGPAQVQTQTFTGAAGTAAAGKTAYQYRVDLSQAAANSEASCVTDVTIDLGPTVQFNYDGTGTPGDVYVIGQGGVGTIGIFSAVKNGKTVQFTFNQPVCAGATAGTGQSSQFFGITSASPPKRVIAKVGWPGMLGLDVTARAPAF